MFIKDICKRVLVKEYYLSNQEKYVPFYFSALVGCCSMFVTLSLSWF